MIGLSALMLAIPSPSNHSDPIVHEQEMNMIGHQTVGMKRHSMGLAGGLQFVQVEGVVALGEEAGPAIIAPLDQVKWQGGKTEPGSAGHGGGSQVRGR
jgi:hypothetical protein